MIKNQSFSVYFLSLGYGLGATVATISVTISGLIGAELAPNLALMTIPYGLQFVGSTISALVSSLLQERFGRRRVVFAAGCIGIISGLMGILSLHFRSFELLLLTHFILGIFLANISLLRFAALDLTSKNKYGKAISLVMSGGVFAGILAPFISRNAAAFFQKLSVYQACYLSISILATMITVMLLFLHFPSEQHKKQAAAIPLKSLLKKRLYLFAVTCGGVGYFLMNLIMINTSIQMKANGFAFTSVTYYIQVHTLAMFVPSLFNIKILDKIGITRFLGLGMVLQLLASTIFIFGQNQVTFLLSLFLLGLSWNILYTSGSYIVGHAFDQPAMKFKAQGINDLIVGIMSTVGALSAGVILGIFGWEKQHIFALVITLLLIVFYLSTRRQLIASQSNNQ